MVKNAVVLMAIVFALAADNRLGADEPNSDASNLNDVEKLARNLSQAFVKKDVETIKKLLADDQFAILRYGPPESKTDQLKKLGDLHFDRAALSDVKAIHISNDVVAVSYRLSRQGNFKGKELSPEAYVLAVWTKRNGQWQQVIYQETLPEKM